VRERAERQEGGEREPKGRGEQGERVGSNETSICNMIKRSQHGHHLFIEAAWVVPPPTFRKIHCKPCRYRNT
jgi:hypothetical protein